MSDTCSLISFLDRSYMAILTRTVKLDEAHKGVTPL